MSESRIVRLTSHRGHRGPPLDPRIVVRLCGLSFDTYWHSVTTAMSRAELAKVRDAINAVLVASEDES